MQPKEEKNQPKQPATSKKRPSTRVLVAVAVVGLAAVLVYMFMANRVSNYEDCVSKNAKNVVVTDDTLTCKANGKTYSQKLPAQTSDYTSKTYQDELLTFQYPESWTVEKVRGLDSPQGSYLVDISSNVTDGILTSTNTPVKFQASAILLVKKSGASVQACTSCVAKDDSEITFYKPEGPFHLVFGIDNSVDGNPAIMTANNDKVEPNSENYPAVIALPNGNSLQIQSFVNYAAVGADGTANVQMTPVQDANDLKTSAVYYRLEGILRSLNFK